MRYFWQQIRTAWGDHRWLALLGGLYALFVIAQCAIASVPGFEYIRALVIALKSSGWAFVFAFFMLLLFFFYSYAWALRETPRHGKGLRGYFLAVAKLFDRKCEHYFDSRLFADGVVGLLILQVMDFVGFQKSLIPYINPFIWDPLFAAWDKALHGGRHPFEAAVPIVESLGAWVPKAVAFCYMGWFFAMFGTCFYALFIDSAFYRHMRFLWAYLFTWVILGSLCALAFSSVGPVYFHDFYPQQPDFYRPLIGHLDRTDLGALFGKYSEVVNLLLEWARNDLILDLNAISAMPSMHVAVAWLLVLYWSAVSRWAAIFAMIFFAAILVGSVYLGLHYAIDGYFSIIGVSLIWWVSGRIVHRLHPGARDMLRSLPHKRG